MLPQSVLIGLVVAIVGYFLQQRAWRHNRREDVRQREFDECIKLIEGLARAFDKRMVAISEFYSLVDRNAVKSEDFEEYKGNIHDWMHEFSSFKSKIYHYFGRTRMLEFENEVHRSLREISDITLRTYRLGKGGLSSVHLEEHKNARAQMGLARHIAFSFLREINEMLSNGEVGRTSLYDNIHAGNLDLISRAYLFQRLLGLKS